MAFRNVMRALLAGVLTSAASAQVRINEVMMNVPNGGDNGFEFIELRSTSPSQSMAGLTLLHIDGDGGSAGMVDQALNLSAFSTGTNNLFLWRDSAVALVPAPAPATTVHVSDFSPDLENGSQTFLLVTGFTGAVGNDYDLNNDGVFDTVLPWTSVIDAVSILENDGAANYGYAGTFGGVQFPQSGFTADAFQRILADTWAYDVTAVANPGPYNSDPTQMMNQFGNPISVAFQMTPGSENVPEPATIVLLVAGLTAIARRRGR